MKMRRRTSAYLLCLAALSGGLAACGNEDSTTALEEDAVAETKSYVTSELQALVDASEAIREAAPAPDADGWNVDDDRAAVEKMRNAWNDARDAYERVEGSIAILFMEQDVSTDERYDGFIEGEADDNLFDDEGVTGMHAIERILWAGEHPTTVVEFESALEGYKAAAFPKTRQEAEDFKNKLAKRLVDDSELMLEEFGPLGLEAPTAFRGVIGSMEEQLEKVTLAATAEDESRYARRTLDDMRANLEGGLAVYQAFRPWVIEDAGEDVAEQIEEGFDKLDAAYKDIDGQAIPEPPASFNPEEPSDEDLESDYGQLYDLLTQETDAKAKDSLISLMVEAAEAMKLAEVE